MNEHIMQFFRYEDEEEQIAKPFAELAGFLLSLPRNPERTVALRKLLESKDAAMRASVAVEVP